MKIYAEMNSSLSIPITVTENSDLTKKKKYVTQLPVSDIAKIPKCKRTDLEQTSDSFEALTERIRQSNPILNNFQPFKNPYNFPSFPAFAIVFIFKKKKVIRNI